MGAPCINDTCSNRSQVDPVTRRLQLDVNLADASAIECIDGQGLNVKLYGDPAAVPVPPNADFNQLGITASGDLFSVPNNAIVVDFGNDDPVNIPQGSQEGNYGSAAITEIITNPYDCQAVMLVVGRFMVGFTIDLDAPGSGTKNGSSIEADLGAGTTTIYPYNADIQSVLTLDTTDQNTNNLAACFHEIGGVSPDQNNKRDWRYFSALTTISANGTRTLRAYARHEGNNESMNVVTVTPTGYPGVPDFAQRGLICEGKAIVFPFNQA